MNLLVTGGTGFFGRALIRNWESARQLVGRLPYEEITILSRSPEKIRATFPQIANLPWIKWHTGDVLHPDSLPQYGKYDHILHAAADSTDVAALTPLEKFHQIVVGTENILRFAVSQGTSRFLLTSSGAVYGPPPLNMVAIPESYNGMPDPMATGNAYGVAKRQAEHLCTLYGQQFGLETVVARCFAFVGEDLPLNAHFAIGNFIRDALYKPAIFVQGNGSPIRSYLDQRDLAIWLTRLLHDGTPGQAYNVGSDQAITIAELASLVRSTLAPEQDVLIANAGVSASGRNIYVPNISKAREEFALQVQIPLADAIRETARHALQRPEECMPSFLTWMER